MNTKHTPGPWRYIPNLRFTSEGQNEDYAYPYLIYAGAEFIAQVATDQMCEETADEANARLLTAAPDLLAALKELVPATGSLDASRYIRALDAAQAAIAKAEGKP